MIQRKKKARRVDEDTPVRIRNINDDLPRPVGIHGEFHRSVFRNNTFVNFPTPMHITGDDNIFINNRAYFRRRR